jgi:hypothetical protein
MSVGRPRDHDHAADKNPRANFDGMKYSAPPSRGQVRSRGRQSRFFASFKSSVSVFARRLATDGQPHQSFRLHSGELRRSGRSKWKSSDQRVLLAGSARGTLRAVPDRPQITAAERLNSDLRAEQRVAQVNAVVGGAKLSGTMRHGQPERRTQKIRLIRSRIGHRQVGQSLPAQATMRDDRPLGIGQIAS